MKDWYALHHNGQMVSAGNHESFGDADDSSYVWLADAEVARGWLIQLAGMFGATVQFTEPGQPELEIAANASVAAALAQAEDPVSILVSEEIDVELRPKSEMDGRVLIGCKGMGTTTVNYTSEGLIIDVFSGDEGDLTPVYTAAIPRDKLEKAPEEQGEVQACGHCGDELTDTSTMNCPNGAVICKTCFDDGVY